MNRADLPVIRVLLSEIGQHLNPKWPAAREGEVVSVYVKWDGQTQWQHMHLNELKPANGPLMPPMKDRPRNTA